MPPGRSPSCTTASSRTSSRCVASWRRPALTFASDTDTEVAVHLVASGLRPAGDGRRFRRLRGAVCGAWRVHSPWSFAHADRAGHSSSRPAATPLVVGVGDGEMFLARDVAAFIEHTRDAVELGQDQAVVDHRGRLSDHQLRPARSRTSARSGSTGTWPAAEKGGYDTSWTRRSPSSPRPWPTPCAATSTTPASCSTSSG